MTKVTTSDHIIGFCPKPVVSLSCLPGIWVILSGISYGIEPVAVPATDTLKFPCWPTGVANTLAGKTGMSATSNVTAILLRYSNSKVL
jgi:hypothetical protein